jgi:hypothetical protein
MASLSTLTWVLMILAITVIGGVLVFNFFQEKKSNPKLPDIAKTKTASSSVATKIAEQARTSNSGIPSLNEVLNNRRHLSLRWVFLLNTWARAKVR